MSLRNLFVLVTIIVLPTQAFSQDEADSRDLATGTDRGSRTLSSLFSSLDTNGDGKLAGDEIERLPSPIKAHFTSGKEPENLAITLEQFVDGLEEMKRSTTERFERYREQTDRVSDQRDRTRSTPRDTPFAQAEGRPMGERAPAVRREGQLAAKAAPVATKSFQVEVVMLRRTSEDLPKRTLAGEVKSGIEGTGPSLSARLLPWLSEPGSEGIHLVDYIQAQSTDGQPIMIQRGGREPYVTGTTSMGSRGGARAVSYSMQNVGTLVRVEPIAITDDGKLGLSVQFEKSYLDQPADDDDDDNDDDDDATELPEEVGKEAAAEDDNGRFPSANSRAQAGFTRTAPSVTQQVPPSIATITSQGSLVLPAGEVGVLSEMAKKSGDTFEEVVILIQWN